MNVNWTKVNSEPTAQESSMTKSKSIRRVIVLPWGTFVYRMELNCSSVKSLHDDFR